MMRISRCVRRNVADPFGDPLTGQREEQQRKAAPIGERERQRDRVEADGPVAPATTIAARTGPAQGTYSTPSASPSPKPLLPGAQLLLRNAARRASRGAPRMREDQPEADERSAR